MFKSLALAATAVIALSIPTSASTKMTEDTCTGFSTLVGYMHGKLTEGDVTASNAFTGTWKIVQSEFGMTSDDALTVALMLIDILYAAKGTDTSPRDLEIMTLAVCFSELD